MANTENIEAKLCAYVDGELDAAGRAEIEAHLAANPQHRQLMAELMQQHALLSDLPRERAPEDLFETVQSHLERAVLLDTGRAVVAGRINPWPGRMAKAAVLLLAVGLAAVVYFVLPVGQQSHNKVAFSPTTIASSLTEAASTLPVAGDLELAMSDPADGDEPETDAPAAKTFDKQLGVATETDRAEAGAKDAAKAEMDSLAGAPSLTTPSLTTPSLPTPASPASPASIAPPAAAPVPVASASPTDVFAKDAGTFAIESKGGGGGAFHNMFADQAVVEEKLKQAPAVKENSLVIFVCAANPEAVNRQVQVFCDDNKIRWEQVAEASPQPIAQDQVLSGARAQRVEGQLRATAPAQNGQFPYPAKGGPEQTDPTVAQAPQADVRPNDQGKLLYKGGGERSGGDTGAVGGADAAASSADAPSQQRAAASQPDAIQPQRQIVSELQQQQLAGPTQASSQLMIARGLTRQQVSALNSNLAVNNAGRIANFQRNTVSNRALEPVATQPATTQPASSFEETNRLARRKASEAVATTQPVAATQPVAPIVLAEPTLAPTAAPTTASADENSPVALDFAKESKSQSTTGPATTPAESDALAKNDALKPTGATTQSVGDSVANDEPVDVVILVQIDPTAVDSAAVQVAAPPTTSAVETPSAESPPAEPAPAVTQPTTTPAP